MRVVKIKAEWIKPIDEKIDSVLTLIAVEDDNGFIDYSKDLYGVISGYDYGCRPAGDYPFYFFGCANPPQQKYLYIKWGRDYQDIDSTLDILGRNLAVGEVITHHEKFGDKNPYHYLVTEYELHI